MNLCSGKWHKSYWLSDIDGHANIYPMPVSLGHWIIFYPDGTSRINDGTNEYNGEWEFNPKKRTLTTKDREGLIHRRIVRLSESDFVYRIRVQDGETEYGFKKIE